MAVIAGIYEIEEQIGAGGGGIVYAGCHTRLHKKVVLKADKRTLQAGEEALRREVDLLKGLSHTYIPQVYDYVQENDTVYTVMDYVEGESLDRVLERGGRIAQKDLIRYACQLLDALSYLHNQEKNGILHGDIKPANIMLRPNGDVCLIDFNIALALGEEGAVQVGFSRGYASPEHYGSGDVQTMDVGGRKEDDRTETVDSRTQEGRRTLLLDVRSDIYSLGATLYHLLSGKRPAQKAAEVVPIGSLRCCSREVAEIIEKAMAPKKQERYQTAGEMLDAFLRLRTKDRRVVRNRRRFAAGTAAFLLLFLAGGASSLAGMKQMERYQEALTLSGYSEAVLADGDVAQAVDYALQALAFDGGLFKDPPPAEAQKALTDALGVYDLSDGFKPKAVVELPSAPIDLSVSPDGTCYAVVYAYEAAVFKADEEEAAAVRRLEPSALSDCLFIDEHTIVCAGEEGIEAYDFEAGKVLWTGETVTNLAISGDRAVVAGIDRDKDHAVLYRTADGKKIAECPFNGRHLEVAANDAFADPANYVFALDETGAWLAVSFSGGALSVFDTSDPENELILYDASEYSGFEGGFCGKYFAFVTRGTGDRLFGLIDLEEAFLAASLESENELALQTDAQGVCLSNGNLLARLDVGTMEETELAYLKGRTIQRFDSGYGYCVLETEEHEVSFYSEGNQEGASTVCKEANDFLRLLDGYALLANRDEPEIHVMALESHKDAQILSYSADYEHEEARISGTGDTAMLFGYRGFQIYGMDGTFKTQYELPEPEQIYDQQYIRDGSASYLEVTWYDGTVRQYGEDGSLLSEEKREAPDKSLDEEFLTDRYRIVSRLHEAPQVYDRETGKSVTELEKDAYLTYVTQLETYIVTEYTSAEGARYGLLLDQNLQKLAYLPDLCDVYGDTLVFDDGKGSIRSCKIRSRQELEELGRAYREADGP